MKAKSSANDIVVSGLGIMSSIGQGKEQFSSALFAGEHAFTVMKRPGRQFKDSRFLGAEMATFHLPAHVPANASRSMSLSTQAALVTLNEAWNDSRLSDVDPERIGLIVGGSNVQQRELYLQQEKYKESPHFLRPTYGMSFMDTDICGACTEYFPIKGLACTVGGASASGQMSIIQAIQNIQAGLVDVCIVIGALMDLSAWECQGFRSLGAMGSDRFAKEPDHACRPFDQDHDGFIYGESCGAIVLEKKNNAQRKKRTSQLLNKESSSDFITGSPYYATISGWGVALDGNRKPDSNSIGEQKAIKQAMLSSDLSANDIDYINPHGSGSASGDQVELDALSKSGLSNAWINSTKSITGHGLTSAGMVEVIATILQMEKSKLHPMRNLERPISDEFCWVGKNSIDESINNAMSLSFGFGGINTALCLQTPN